MKNTRILKTLLLLVVVLFSFVSFANSNDTIKSAVSRTVGADMDIAAYDANNEILCIINKVDNAADILKLHDNGYQIVGTYQIDSVRKRHDVEFIFRPCNIFLQDGNIVILANNKIASKLIVLKEDASVLSKVEIPFRSTDITVDVNNKQFVIVGTNELGYITGFVSFADGLEQMIYDEHNSFRYDKIKAADAFVEKDPYGAILAMVSMSIVFATLLMLFLVFNNIGRLFRAHAANKSKTSTAVSPTDALKPKKHTHTGEEIAAIVAAVHFYNLENSDDADAKLTITRISKRYSPWSSKIYGLNNFNRR